MGRPKTSQNQCAVLSCSPKLISPSPYAPHLDLTGGGNTMVALLGRRIGVAAAAAAFIALAAFGSASPSPKSFVKSTVAAHDVVIFSKSYCPYDPLSPSIA